MEFNIKHTIKLENPAELFLVYYKLYRYSIIMYTVFWTVFPFFFFLCTKQNKSCSSMKTIILWARKCQKLFSTVRKYNFFLLTCIIWHKIIRETDMNPFKLGIDILWKCCWNDLFLVLQVPLRFLNTMKLLEPLLNSPLDKKCMAKHF